jgi:hypothetical protein
MEEPSGIKMFLKRAVAALWLLCFFSFSLVAQTSGNKPKRGDEGMDYVAVRQDIVRFEAALNDAIDTFIKDPFGVVNKAKGAYLPRFGINFTFLINIQRAIMNTPFGEVRRHPATPEQKRQRIEELKEILIRLLQDNGKGFQQLSREDSIAIVAFIDDKNFLEPSANKTIVLNVLKKDLDELGNKNERLKEFKQRIKIVEY